MEVSDGGDMNAPDWGRYQVNTDKKGSPLGDPTRWGAQVPTFLDPAANNVFSDQIVFAQTQDLYARNWAVVGTITLPQATWNTPGNLVAFPLVVSLQCILGVGQTQVEHQILLFAGQNPNLGLCNTQNAFNNGPYLSTFPDGIQETRAFAAIGALIGNSINLRIRYIIGTGVGLPATALAKVILTPFAPGGGL